MEEWRVTTMLLCSYGFIKEIRPSEPFLTEYLLGNSSGITQDELYHDVYPVWTYSYLGVLVLVFLFTDLARYKPVIVFEGFAYILTWVLLLWGYGVAQMKMMQFAYGLATSTEVAYFTYIYAKISGQYYRQVTSWTRAALLLGRFLSGLLSQLLISFNIVSYRGLNYISLAMVSLATVVSFFLPPVESAVYFHRTPEPELVPITSSSPSHTSSPPALSLGGKVRAALPLIWRDFRAAFSDLAVLKWSIWWALAMCGNFQVGNYIQPLWETIQPMQEGGELLNGGVEATTTLTGAALALMLSFVHLNWSLVGEASLALLSVLDAALLYTMATTHSIWTAYISYLLFRALYQMMITVASFEIASSISQDSYGLVFGFNTFLALAFQTILTTVVADRVGLQLEPREQFEVYAGFFLVVGILFLLTSGVMLCRGGWMRIMREGVWVREDRVVEGGRPDPPVGSTDLQ